MDSNIGNANFSVTDIRHKRIQKACQMIADGHNVSETAYSCGFADPNYFSKVFKKVVGVAPSEYTKQSH